MPSRHPWLVFLSVFAALGFITVGTSAQPMIRRATSVASLLTFPNFFHGQQVTVTGELVTQGLSLTLAGPDELPLLHVVQKGAANSTGPVEISGRFYDVGRLEPDDPRLADQTLEGLLAPGDRRPKQGEVLVLIASRMSPANPPAAPSIRTIALEPARYGDQHVTVTGQFRGRNLYGDLPQAPGLSKWDFVLRSADAAIWVTGIRPKGKGYDLDVEARVDTSHWLEVSGAVRSNRGLVWIDAKQVALTKPTTETSEEQAPVPTQGASPEVIFSAPTEGETDVELGTAIRIQFSRDLDPATIRNHVKVSYGAREATERGEMAPPAIQFIANYVTASRVLEIRFTNPLERFRTLKLDLMEGIAAPDGATLKPWTLTFGLGGS